MTESVETQWHSRC